MCGINSNTGNGNIILLRHVSKYFKIGENTVKALDNLTCYFKKEKMTAVVGKSGCGKSTLLNLIGSLEKPDTGEIFVGNLCLNRLSEKETVDFRRKTIGFVFQSFNLIPNLTAIENVILPLEFTNKGQMKEKMKIASFLLNEVGVEKNRFEHTPRRLSGGEQQRVAIARALVNNPEIILADEPTGNLDAVVGNKIMKILKSLTIEGKTVLVVTHDMTIRDISDETVTIYDGRIQFEKR